MVKDKNNNNINSSNSLVFGLWPQTTTQVIPWPQTKTLHIPLFNNVQIPKHFNGHFARKNLLLEPGFEPMTFRLESSGHFLTVLWGTLRKSKKPLL